MSRTREDILRKVTLLLNKAASTNFDEEARSYQAKADELMLEWAVEEFELGHQDPRNQRYKPEVRTFTFADELSRNGVWRHVFDALVRFTRCKMASNTWDRAQVVGYPGDLDYLETLQVILQLHVVKTIFPTVDPTKSEAENLYNLRQAGNTWDKCYRIMHPDKGAAPKSERVRYTKVVGDYARKNNLPRNMTASQEGYRNQFISAFAYRLSARLNEIMGEQDKENKFGLVLRDRASDLDEFLWTMFPKLRPHPADCDCDEHHRCNDPKCSRCEWRRKPVRVRYSAVKEFKYNAAANQAGRRAADSADLGQTRINSGERKQVN